MLLPLLIIFIILSIPLVWWIWDLQETLLHGPITGVAII
jgi:hypothetical protein